MHLFYFSSELCSLVFTFKAVFQILKLHDPYFLFFFVQKIYVIFSDSHVRTKAILTLLGQVFLRTHMQHEDQIYILNLMAH